MRSAIGLGLIVVAAVVWHSQRAASTPAYQQTAIAQPTSPNAPGQPYEGTVQQIPGKVMAANYDLGGEGKGYHVTSEAGGDNWERNDGVDIDECSDTGGGFNLGYSAPGQWFHYTVDVASAGKYIVGFRVASGRHGGSIHLEDAAGTNLTGAITIPPTRGWQNWTTIQVEAALTAGRQVLTLCEDSDGVNINYIAFDPLVAPSPPTTVTIEPRKSEIALMWAPAEGANTYIVYRNGTTIAKDVSTIHYIDTGLTAGKQYKYAVASVNLVGTSKTSATVSAKPGGRTADADLGPGTLIFDATMPMATIQAQIDDIYAKQRGNQFGADRYAILFKPGSYKLKVNVGYYTQVLGLGQQPDDTTIDGYVQQRGALGRGNATCNFWSGAENFAVTPSSSAGTDMWAVSQADPMRRVHVMGNLVLDDHGGWSSGGFLSDSVVDGQVNEGTQQQWLSRNDQWGSWTGHNWNTVLVGNDSKVPPGTTGGNDGPTTPLPSYTVVDKTPVVREKPFLTVDDGGNWGVFVPSVRTDSHGITWADGEGPGETRPLAQFYVAHPSDTSATINDALDKGKDLLLTPGTYALDGPIHVRRADTVILGIGLATLKPTGGQPAMDVADVDGAIISGILFDAGEHSSSVLMRVGPMGSSLRHVENPTSLHDLFFRVGGAGVGKAAVSLQINSNDVIGDDFWVWRADHSQGVGWDQNVAANGLVVNGRAVTIYGLAVEHYQSYQTVWNGEDGRCYFYQSECPYDVPSQAEWMDGDVKGFASYKVADNVTTYHAYGLGVYCLFYADRSIHLDSAIEAPNAPGITFSGMTTVSLGGGVGAITHIVNSTGATVQSHATVARLARYPDAGSIASADPVGTH